MIIEFSEEELQHIQKLAIKRSRFKRQNRIQTRKFTEKKSDLQIDIEGLQAEFAVAKFLKSNVNLENTFAGDDGTDLKFNNKCIQVKFSGYSFGDFYVNNLKDIQDIGILVISKGSKLKICGWIDRDTFMKKHQVKNFGYGKRYCVSQRDLFPIETLK